MELCALKVWLRSEWEVVSDSISASSVQGKSDFYYREPTQRVTGRVIRARQSFDADTESRPPKSDYCGCCIANTLARFATDSTITRKLSWYVVVLWWCSVSLLIGVQTLVGLPD